LISEEATSLRSLPERFARDSTVEVFQRATGVFPLMRCSCQQRMGTGTRSTRATAPTTWAGLPVVRDPARIRRSAARLNRCPERVTR